MILHHRLDNRCPEALVAIFGLCRRSQLVLRHATGAPGHHLPTSNTDKWKDRTGILTTMKKWAYGRVQH